jgi:dTDP-4-amino-4,6-dideoxygalactose transaminase
MIDEAMIAGVGETLRSRWIASGPQVAAFEKALSAYVGGRPVRVMTSATGAMQVALEMLGVGPGDEVITPSQSFFATANMIEKVGATTVFVDVDLATRNLDFAQADAAVTPRTRVLLPTHFNAPIDPARLAAFRARHGVRILEDAALAIGSRVGGAPVGATGDLVSFSFHPNKNMTTIEGGALSLASAAELEAIELQRFHGLKRDADGGSDVLLPGGKYNLSDVSARIGLSQLKQLDGFIERRHALIARYFERLQTEPACLLPARGGADHSWHIFAPLLPLDQVDLSRAQFIKAMHERGIAVGVHYPALHLFTAYRKLGYREGDFPNAERIGRETVTLPLFPTLELADVDRVCDAVRDVLAAAPRKHR